MKKLKFAESTRLLRSNQQPHQILEDNGKVMKEVLILQDPKKVGHKFEVETIKELRMGEGDFLLFVEEAELRKTLG